MTPHVTKDYGVLTDATTIRFERLLPGPIERVWEYLTDSDKRAEWFAGGPMELRVGGALEFRFWNSKLSPIAEPTPEQYRKHEGAASPGRVTRCEPPHVLAFYWGGGCGDDGDNSEVTFELSSQGDKVLLVLTHRRLATRKSRLSVAGGWHTHLGILESRLAGTTPKPFWSTHAEVEKEYDAMLPGD